MRGIYAQLRARAAGPPSVRRAHGAGTLHHTSWQHHSVIVIRFDPQVPPTIKFGQRSNDVSTPRRLLRVPGLAAVFQSFHVTPHHRTASALVPERAHKSTREHSRAETRSALAGDEQRLARRPTSVTRPARAAVFYKGWAVGRPGQGAQISLASGACRPPASCTSCVLHVLPPRPIRGLLGKVLGG